MRTYLNTVAIEPNRWTKERIPARDLVELLPAIRDAGFEHLEVWQYHVSRKSDSELGSLRDAAGKLGLDMPIVGVYPQFHLEDEEADAARREMYRALDVAALLGAKWVKFFFGRVAAREMEPRQFELTDARAHAWIGYGRQEHGLSFCAELHGGTLFDPYESGRTYVAKRPELGVKICWQPYSGEDLKRTLEIIRDLGPELVHAHFQPSNKEGRCRLPEAELDYRQIIPALQAANPQFIPSIEFIPGGFASADGTFSLDRALADAMGDARWVDELLQNPPAADAS
jgi:sugar phosphate isomerase/epimerase